MDADADVVRDGKAGVVQIHAAKKLEGAAAHPVNRGGLCARGQAAIQVTYHPDRITQPLKRSRQSRRRARTRRSPGTTALAELVGEAGRAGGGGSQRALGVLARHRARSSRRR